MRDDTAPPRPAGPAMKDEAPGRDPASLTELLDALRPAPGADRITVAEILRRFGGRSFAPVILVPALILVSPLSAIPGSPTLGMLIIVTVTVQALLGRRHLWLPQVLMRRSVPAHRMARAVAWLERPVAWVDRHTRDRLHLLTVAPLDRIALLAILCTALPWPLLEPLPMVTSIGAFGVSMLALGMMVRDGLYIVLGYAFIGGLAAGLAAIWQGLV